jgi:hypothetical protein
MFNKPWFQWTLILSFMLLVGFCLANAFYSKSFIAVLLALIAFSAGIYFVYLLQGMKRAQKENAL